MLKLFILAMAAISCAHECPVPIVCPVETVPMCEQGPLPSAVPAMGPEAPKSEAAPAPTPEPTKAVAKKKAKAK